jgi:cysteinyl-tRNA synthetase
MFCVAPNEKAVGRSDATMMVGWKTKAWFCFLVKTTVSLSCTRRVALAFNTAPWQSILDGHKAFSHFSNRRYASRQTTQLQAADAPTTVADAEQRPLLMYNSLSREKEVFRPRKRNSAAGGGNGGETVTEKNTVPTVVTMYTCGPTVYDVAHLGNFRAFLTYDLLKRVLLYLGYRVRHVCNITDIDDKIIIRANERQIAMGQIGAALTEPYEAAFLHDLQSLNCLPATVYPRATQHVPVMIRFVQDLAQKGLAYETNDGSWYYATQEKPALRYGQQLVQLNYDDMVEQKETGVENADDKRHFADFCLWKAYKEGIDRADAAWDSTTFVAQRVGSDMDEDDDDNDDAMPPSESPEECRQNQPWPRAEPAIQLGRPGWHLECSAMARTYFGQETLDFHGGGIDLKFPHHENEIAQSEGLLGPNQPFCNCWFHNGFVNIGNEDEKMSKSLGNFVTLADACPTLADQRAYRYLVISSHYRNPLRFTKAAMDAAKNAIKRMDKLLKAIDEIVAAPSAVSSTTTTTTGTLSSKLRNEISTSLEAFETAIRDDLSMPRASAALFAIIKAAEQELKRSSSVTNNDAASGSADVLGLQLAADTIRKMDQIFGVFYAPNDNETIQGSHDDEATTDVVPEDVMKLVLQRAAAKNSKDWELADSLRRRVAELGFAIKDVKDGAPVVTPLEV